MHLWVVISAGSEKLWQEWIVCVYLGDLAVLALLFDLSTFYRVQSISSNSSISSPRCGSVIGIAKSRHGASDPPDPLKDGMMWIPIGRTAREVESGLLYSYLYISCLSKV